MEQGKKRYRKIRMKHNTVKMKISHLLAKFRFEGILTGKGAIL